MRQLTIALACLASVLISACETYDNIPVYETEQPVNLAAMSTPANDSVELTELELEAPGQGGALLFRVEDQIRVSIWGHPELDHIAQVQANGSVTFPLVGEVQAAGRTAAEMRQEIEARLSTLSQPTSPGLRYGDVVTLFVWQHAEAGYSAVVQPDGTVTLPLAGTMSVVERPLPDINEKLTQRLAAHIRDPRAWLIPEISDRNVILDPIVSILPVELTQRRATVLGEVFAPGQQVLTPDSRVLDLLASAQISDLGDLDSVILIRNYSSAKPMYRRLELGKFLAGDTPLQNIYVQERDVLFVPKTTMARVGSVIETFFARTRPLFDWYLASASAINYRSDRDLNRQLNKAAIDAYERGFVGAPFPGGSP